jgi:FkbM family methyltransferase
MAMGNRLGLYLDQAGQMLASSSIYQKFLSPALNKMRINHAYKKVIIWLLDEEEISIDGTSINVQIDSEVELRHATDNISAEEVLLKEILNNISNSDVFWDVGGNIGTHALLVSKKYPKAEVVTFEPFPRSADRIRENAGINNLDVDVMNKALSSSNETKKFSVSDSSVGGGGSLHRKYDDGEVISVDSQTGDRIIEEENISPPTVVKIDVEGAELEVLRGMKKALEEDCNVLYCEIHGDNHAKVAEFLRHLGFKSNILYDEERLHLKAEKS